jgi:hypothetical protein
VREGIGNVRPKHAVDAASGAWQCQFCVNFFVCCYVVGQVLLKGSLLQLCRTTYRATIIVHRGACHAVEV